MTQTITQKDDSDYDSDLWLRLFQKLNCKLRLKSYNWVSEFRLRLLLNTQSGDGAKEQTKMEEDYIIYTFFIF